MYAISLGAEGCGCDPDRILCSNTFRPLMWVLRSVEASGLHYHYGTLGSVGAW